MPPAAELQALADQIKARRSLPYSPILRTEAVKVVVARPYVTTCVLCGVESDRFTCAGCDEGYRELGL